MIIVCDEKLKNKLGRGEHNGFFWTAQHFVYEIKKNSLIYKYNDMFRHI